MILRVTIAGDPRSKGSLVPIPRGKGAPGVWMKESAGEGLRTWRERLAAGIVGPAGGPSLEPVAVFCHFRFAPPKKPRYRWPIAKGRNDADKLARAVLDHLSGVVVEDDSQVVCLVSTKSYGTPGVDIWVEELSALADPDHRKTFRPALAALMLEAIRHVDVLEGGEVIRGVEGRARQTNGGPELALPLHGSS